MKKVIPEIVEHYCDRCEKKIDSRNTDATGKVDFVGRDFQGCAVGGQAKEFEFCSSCTSDFQKFLKGE